MPNQKQTIQEEKKDSDPTTAAGASAAHQVYIESGDHGWVPVQVLSIDEKKQEAIVSADEYENEQSMLTCHGAGNEQRIEFAVDLRNYENGVLPLQNSTQEGDLVEYEDMVDMPYLHEVSNKLSLSICAWT